jgi:hypothetical protein
MPQKNRPRKSSDGSDGVTLPHSPSATSVTLHVALAIERQSILWNKRRMEIEIKHLKVSDLPKYNQNDQEGWDGQGM